MTGTSSNRVDGKFQAFAVASERCPEGFIFAHHPRARRSVKCQSPGAACLFGLASVDRHAGGAFVSVARQCGESDIFKNGRVA